MAFQPKQASDRNAAVMAEIMGSTNNQAIQHALMLIPAIKDGDVVHDNAAGAGAASEEILKGLSDEANIQICATDISADFMKSLQATADARKWPITTSVMNAYDLTFPADKFTHSITTFVGGLFGGDGSASKQIYRILKPGGLAIVASGLYMPFIQPMVHAHHRTRGEQTPIPPMLAAYCDLSQDTFISDFKAGGFSEVKDYITEADLVVADVSRWVQLMWSYMGAGTGGWTQNDEDKWDEAIDDVIEQLQIAEGVSRNESGDFVMALRGLIVVATK